VRSRGELFAACALACCLALAGCSGSLVHRPQGAGEGGGSANVSPSELVRASGVVEARKVILAPEVTARVVAVYVGEGERVSPGQELVQLDDRSFRAELAEAEAEVALAEAQLARVQAGVREEELAVADAGAALAQAKAEAACQEWKDAELLRDNPQELEVEIASARARVAAAEHRVKAAAALKDAAELWAALRERQVKQVEAGADVEVDTPAGKVKVHVDADEETRRQAWAAWNLASSELWQAWARLRQAEAALEAARRDLEELQAQTNNRQAAELDVARAKGACEEAKAAAQAAAEQAQALRQVPRAEDVEAAEAALALARSRLAALQGEERKYRLRSPIDGVVLEQLLEPGEVAVVGRPALIVADLRLLEVTLYVEASQLGRVFIGQDVSLTTDSFPGEQFPGMVTWVSDRAEFTPQNVQTAAERATMVYAVKVVVPNDDGRLKPGLPVDATFVE